MSPSHRKSVYQTAGTGPGGGRSSAHHLHIPSTIYPPAFRHHQRAGHRRLTRRARVHARTRATLDTSGPTFVVFLLGVILIVGGLIYLPLLILVPIGERITG
jgi:hypothetical protein